MSDKDIQILCQIRNIPELLRDKIIKMTTEGLSKSSLEKDYKRNFIRGGGRPEPPVQSPRTPWCAPTGASAAWWRRS